MKKYYPSDQRRLIEQATFTYSPLVKDLGKQGKKLEDQATVEAIKASNSKEALKALKPEENQELQSVKELFPKTMGTNEIKNDTDEFRKWHEKIKHKRLKM